MSPGEAKILTHAGLISIAGNRGYKKGWAAVKYKKIYGAWPDGDPPPENPSGELSWWIKQQSKQYAKSMREKEAAADVSSIDGGNAKRGDIRSDVIITKASKLNPTGNPPETLMSHEDWDVDL